MSWFTFAFKNLKSARCHLEKIWSHSHFTFNLKLLWYATYHYIQSCSIIKAQELYNSLFFPNIWKKITKFSETQQITTQNSKTYIAIFFIFIWVIWNIFLRQNSHTHRTLECWPRFQCHCTVWNRLPTYISRIWQSFVLKSRLETSVVYQL